MNRKLSPALFTLILGVLLAGNALAATSGAPYYIAANGSDTNSGTSETSPWAHLPGMATWTGSHTPVAGDTFILRGCDVWPNASFPITWTWSGTSGHVILIDRDVTWYNTTNCPGGWNRPVFDAGSTVINPPECTANHSNIFFIANSVNYLTLKWIEAKNLYWNSDQQNGAGCFLTVAIFVANSSDHITLDSWYVHHWTVGASATDTDRMITQSNSSPFCVNCLLTNSVIDNSDGTTNSGGGVRFNATNNVIHDVVNALKMVYQGEMGGNNIYNVNASFDGISHPNCIETTGALGPTGIYYIHDNYIHNISGCEGLQVGNAGETDYVWNNIWVMGASSGANGPQVPQADSGTSTWSLYFWNNTVSWGFPHGCIITGGHATAINNWFAQNNHCINVNGSTVTGTPLVPVGSTAIDHNVGITMANATSQGYVNGGAYAYSPQNSACNGIPTNCPIGVGANLTSSWPGGFGTNDTTYACTEQTINGVVQSVCPARATTNARSSTWDVGAYEWAGSTPPPHPPTGLAAVIH